MAATISERQRAAGIKTFDPESQLGSQVTEFDPITGKPRVVVVDGCTYSMGDEALIQAGYTYLRGHGVKIDDERGWKFLRPNGRLRKAVFVG